MKNDTSADLMLLAYSLATGASKASIIRSCIVESIERALRQNAGIRERYIAARSKLLSERRVVDIATRRTK